MLGNIPGFVAGKTLGVAMAGILSLPPFGVAVVFRVINARPESLCKCAVASGGRTRKMCKVVHETESDTEPDQNPPIADNLLAC